ncbi:MAG: MerR family transcriptional regulator [Phycisphaerae bacterium]|nr:MerR family transcriptional regulator [Phycisphaerae bacterium]MDP7287439.1 MerR family transcriptional regulator [Phycisphaerae bacterium]
MDSEEQSPQSLVRISAAAEAAEVSKQTVEYYIMLGLLEPVRVEGRKGRFFDQELITRIRLIREMNKSGLTLRDIRETYLSNR